MRKLASRKLTLFGKKSILKSLISAKCVHLFITLPNIIKELDAMSYKFIWNDGPDKIKY